MTDWHVDIGLEIHVQLATKTKIFSGSSTDFGAAPNTQASAIDLAMPGVLPTLNKDVYRLAIRFGLGVGADIARRSVFDRKNYFYPDLPKGYQITQMDAPIVNGGSVTIKVGDKPLNIRITRAHLEEDAGKSLHEDFHGMTGIDLNRAGTPLLEIVSEPDMHSAAEAVAYARKIHQLVTYLGVSDGNMAEGSLRCDANVSVRRSSDDELGTRTETKNVNSFRFLERAINYEIERQTTRLESGERIIQETRLYDPDRDETRPMRSKETATDYRYFPEPDLLPVVVDEETIEQIRKEMPELPDARASRYVAELDLSQGDAEVLTGSLALADYFETAAAIAGDAKLTANWVRVELLGRLNREGLEIGSAEVAPAQLGELLLRVADQTISGKIAKTVFDALWQGEAASVDEYIEANGLKQVSDSGALVPIVDKIISDNPGQVAQFKAGKTKVMGFFVGQVMKATGGKANPGQVNELITQRLAE